METLSQKWSHIQSSLFPYLQTEVSTLTESHKLFCSVLELIELDAFISAPRSGRGRPVKDRCAIARAFVAKVVFNLSSTRQLIDHLRTDLTLRRLCGWEWEKVPSESTFSHAYGEFAQSGLTTKAHEALIRDYQSDRLVGHISRDSTDIVAREKPVAKPPKPSKPKGKPGRPRKGEERPAKEPPLVERQRGMSLDDMLRGLPRACDVGMKKKPSGNYCWIGYKAHVDWADGEIPISLVLTSASVHDSQVAIPLAAMSADRVESFYALMDSAYDSPAIKEHARSLGIVPIIEANRRRGKAVEMEPADRQRYRERTTAERGFSLLKERFGGRNIRVRGHMKVLAHLGFCLLALTAERLLNLLL